MKHYFVLWLLWDQHLKMQKFKKKKSLNLKIYDRDGQQSLAAWKLNSQYVVFISLIFIFCDIFATNFSNIFSYSDD